MSNENNFPNSYRFIIKSKTNTMKTKKMYLVLFSFITLSSTFINCRSDDDKVILEEGETPNQPDKTVNQAPDDFELIAVIDGATDVDVMPNFLWNAAVDSDGDSISYELFVDENSNPTTSLANTINETNFTLEERLPLNQDLFWKVVAIDSEGNTTSSETFSFTTRNLHIPETPVIASAAFSERRDHTSVVFDNKMWVIGGYDGFSHLNDIWQSTDGETWTQVTAEAPFHKRRFHSTVVFDNKIWVMGGHNGSDILTDIWQSSDGENWTLVTGGLPFIISYDQSVIAFQNKLWVIGSGSGPAKSMNTIWQSSDGETWTSVDSQITFTDRFGFATLVFDNKIWIIGGNGAGAENFNTPLNDTWQSSDGKIWNQVNANTLFSGRKGHTSVVFDDKMWIIGGFDGSSRVNDIWQSADGETWTQVIKEGPYTGRLEYTPISFNNKIWIIGGSTGSALLNDVWSMD